LGKKTLTVKRVQFYGVMPLPCMRLDRFSVVLALILATGLALGSPVSAQKISALSANELILAADGGSASLAIFGRGLDLFTSVELVSTDRSVSTKGLRISMDPVDGKQREIIIGSRGAQPGHFMVELIDHKRRVHQLDLVVIVEASKDIEPPRVDPVKITLPAHGGHAEFSIIGNDMRTFKAVGLVAEDGQSDTDGIDIRMDRPKGIYWDGSLQTDDAQPGRYQLELTDRKGGIHPLDFTLIVEALIETPRVEPSQLSLDADGGAASFTMFGNDMAVFQTIELVPDGSTSSKGTRIAMKSPKGNQRHVSIRVSRAEPGNFGVQLTDVDGGIHRLDLSVTLNEPLTITSLEIDPQSAFPHTPVRVTAILNRPTDITVDVSLTADLTNIVHRLPGVITIEAGQDQATEEFSVGPATGTANIVAELGKKSATADIRVVPRPAPRYFLDEAGELLAQLIGIRAVAYGSGLQVSSVVSGGWAAFQRISMGDFLYGVNGTLLANLSTEALLNLLSLPQIQLNVRHESGQIENFALVNSPLEENSALVLAKMGLSATIHGSMLRVTAVESIPQAQGIQLPEFLFESDDMIQYINTSPAWSLSALERVQQLGESPFDLQVLRQGQENLIDVACAWQTIQPQGAGQFTVSWERPVCHQE
jgi:hypothetical protein